MIRISLKNCTRWLWFLSLYINIIKNFSNIWFPCDFLNGFVLKKYEYTLKSSGAINSVSFFSDITGPVDLRNGSRDWEKSKGFSVRLNLIWFLDEMEDCTIDLILTGVVGEGLTGLGEMLSLLCLNEIWVTDCRFIEILVAKISYLKLKSSSLPRTSRSFISLAFMISSLTIPLLASLVWTICKNIRKICAMPSQIFFNDRFQMH